MSGGDWVSANQRLLVAEFRRIAAQITGKQGTGHDQELAAARAAMPQAAAIDVLTEVFALTNFERDVLLLCAGLTLSDELAVACAPYVGAASHTHMTFDLALRLQDAHWSALAPIRPLRASRLIHVHDDRALRTSRVSIEERVLHYLAGVNYLDPRLNSLLHEPAETGMLARSHQCAVESAILALDAGQAGTILQLVGDDTSAQAEVARRIAANYGLRLRIMRAEDVPADRDSANNLAAIWNRESALLGYALLLQTEGKESEALPRFSGQLTGLAFLAAADAAPIDRILCLRVLKPDALEQKRMWSEALGEVASSLNGSLDAVAAQFRLASADVAHTALELRTLTRDPEALEHALWTACRDRLRTSLEGLAQRIEPKATWQDLVLPEQQITLLRQVAAHTRQRLKVHEQWGFAAKCARGLGISVLFSGESGTGKTLAAEVLANDLRLDLYRIDLSAMVSKYIGETEKNLRRVFDAAQTSGAILLFDEADALFGKRSEVKNSHDRYANIEVSYLLQRMEEYRGLAILTTNLKGALDPAFQRRLQFVVQFPFPDADLRERIWLGVFPRATPLEDIEPARLAKLNVAGGSIRNIAMGAAFLAADAGTPVGMGHLLQAARSEAVKRDRPFSDAEVRGWV